MENAVNGPSEPCENQTAGATALVVREPYVMNTLKGIHHAKFFSSGFLDLSIFEHRLSTYKKKWPLTFITAHQMAKAGLYYLGHQDYVRCSYCSNDFDYWVLGQNPYDEHKRKSPGCRFFSEDQDYDADEFYDDLSPIGPNSDSDINKVQNFLYSVGAEKKTNVLKHNKSFCSYDSRLRTFNSCPLDIKQNIFLLCKAGFYYIGDGKEDKMLCFCCNQGLMDWEKDDDPWIEHARWSPDCSFVILNKGKQFVKEFGREVKDDPVHNQIELCKMITVHKNVSVIEQNTKTNITKRTRDYLQTTNPTVSTFPSSFQQDPNTVPDGIICKICYKEKMEVVFIPCGHTIACIQCAVTLDDCAICRQPIKMAIKVFMCTNKKIDDYLDKLVYSSPSNSVEESLGLEQCKVCRKVQVGVAFIPCRHVCTCLDCASKIKQCPICFEALFAFIQIYI